MWGPVSSPTSLWFYDQMCSYINKCLMQSCFFLFILFVFNLMFYSWHWFRSCYSRIPGTWTSISLRFYLPKIRMSSSWCFRGLSTAWFSLLWNTFHSQTDPIAFRQNSTCQTCSIGCEMLYCSSSSVCQNLDLVSPVVNIMNNQVMCQQIFAVDNDLFAVFCSLVLDPMHSFI